MQGIESNDEQTAFKLCNGLFSWSPACTMFEPFHNK